MLLKQVTCRTCNMTRLSIHMTLSHTSTRHLPLSYLYTGGSTSNPTSNPMNLTSSTSAQRLAICRV
jgi:hypothetical protein